MTGAASINRSGFHTLHFVILLFTPLLILCSGPGQMTRIQRHETGYASYYARSLHGNPTASGETYNENELTAAHRTFSFGEKIQVTNLENGRSVVVRINDRGPFVKNRIIDLSYAAAREIGMIKSGIVRVSLERIQ